MRMRSALVLAFLGVSACEGEPVEDTADATGVTFADGSRDARAAVAFLNDPASDAAELKAAGLNKTISKLVLDRRSGADGQFGTADDGSFETLTEFDALKGVGPATLQKLAAYALARDFGNERGIFHDVYFTEVQADRVLDVVNTVSLQAIDAETSIDKRALENIVAARPIVSMAQLTTISRVKGSATLLLREYADEKLGPPFCSEEDPCPSGLSCTGGTDAPGFCVDMTNVPGSGEACSSEGICGAGLVCGGHSPSFDGICVPEWMQGEFVNESSGGIPDGPDGGVGVSVQAIGLATVPMNAVVRVIVDHPRPDDLELTLENTHGTVVPVWDPSMGPLPTAPEGIVVDVPGDESANGLWTLTAFDRVQGQTGTLSLFTLELVSRFD